MTDATDARCWASCRKRWWFGRGRFAAVAIGFAASFLAAWLVVRSLLDHVSRHGFKLFAWWRVIVGTLGLIVLAIGH